MKKEITLLTIIVVMFLGINTSSVFGIDLELEYEPGYPYVNGYVGDSEYFDSSDNVYINDGNNNTELPDGGEVYAVPCIKINYDLTFEVSCFQYNKEVFETKMIPVENLSGGTLMPIWKVELPNLNPFTFDQGTFVESHHFELDSNDSENICLNIDEQLEEYGVLTVECAILPGHPVAFEFDMIRFDHPEDPDGLYLELDLQSITTPW